MSHEEKSTNKSYGYDRLNHLTEVLEHLDQSETEIPLEVIISIQKIIKKYKYTHINPSKVKRILQQLNSTTSYEKIAEITKKIHHI